MKNTFIIYIYIYIYIYIRIYISRIYILDTKSIIYAIVVLSYYKIVSNQYIFILKYWTIFIVNIS